MEKDYDRIKNSIESGDISPELLFDLISIIYERREIADKKTSKLLCELSKYTSQDIIPTCLIRDLTRDDYIYELCLDAGVNPGYFATALGAYYAEAASVQFTYKPVTLRLDTDELSQVHFNKVFRNIYHLCNDCVNTQ